MTSIFGMQISHGASPSRHETLFSPNTRRAETISDASQPADTAASNANNLNLYHSSETTAAFQHAVSDPFLLTGPSPTFQFNILDVGGDWRSVIAANQSQRAFETETSTPLSPPQHTANASAIISANVSQPTERYDSYTTAPVPTASDAAISPITPQPILSAVPVQAQDPQAAYAGLSAIHLTPYNSSLDISL